MRVAECVYKDVCLDESAFRGQVTMRLRADSSADDLYEVGDIEREAQNDDVVDSNEVEALNDFAAADDNL